MTKILTFEFSRFGSIETTKRVCRGTFSFFVEKEQNASIIARIQDSD